MALDAAQDLLVNGAHDLGRHELARIAARQRPSRAEKVLAGAANLERHGVANVRILAGDAERIPLPDTSVDVVTSNGVLNLVPDKARATEELFRVLRPGGFVQIADIVLGRPASEACRKNPELWAECIVGAVSEASYTGLLEAAGFAEIESLASFDYFAGSPSRETRDVAGSLGAQAVVLRARKPEQTAR